MEMCEGRTAADEATTSGRREKSAKFEKGEEGKGEVKERWGKGKGMLQRNQKEKEFDKLIRKERSFILPGLFCSDTKRGYLCGRETEFK